MAFKLNKTRHLAFINTMAMVGVLLPAMCTAQAADVENTTARFQTTYNWQKHPAFAAAYSGPNSIIADSEKMYTLTATAFFGFRPWQDGELYFNPEMAQGVPFSTNLVGLGGFTNGEITRAAGTLRRKLWADQGSLTLRVADPFNLMTYGYRTADGRVIELSEQHFGQRGLFLTISRNFGQELKLRPRQQDAEPQGSPQPGPP